MLALLDRVAPEIGGTQSPAFADFAANLDRMIARYRREGKDPFDLLDPWKVDYAANSKIISAYRPASGNIEEAPLAPPGTRNSGDLLHQPVIRKSTVRTTVTVTIFTEPKGGSSSDDQGLRSP